MDVYNDYVPNSWQKKFHEGDWKYCILPGAKGSGKSRAAVEEILACALEYAGTHYLIGRKTLPSLRDSTWTEVGKIVHPSLIKRETKTPMMIELINGSRILGRPLDEMKKLDSMEISGFFVDEADEIEKEMFDTLKDRVRQMIVVDGRRVSPRYRGILGFNPTDEDHWIPQFFFDENCPKDHAIFQSSVYDNLSNLPDGYLEQLKATYSEAMQQRIIHGLFGKVHKGRPVFPAFSRGNYIFPIEADQSKTMFRSWDFGYNNPACVWFQWDQGQLRVLAEKQGKKIYLDDFVKECQRYEKELFPLATTFKDFCDPRGSDESDKGQTSIQILNEFGIYPVHRRTRILEGIKAIKGLLDTKHQNGEPNFLIHGRCKILVEGFRGGYHRLDGQDDPNKDGYYDHLMDALRYGALHLVKRWQFNRANSQYNSQVIYTKGGRRIEI